MFGVMKYTSPDLTWLHARSQTDWKGSMHVQATIMQHKAIESSMSMLKYMLVDGQQLNLNLLVTVFKMSPCMHADVYQFNLYAPLVAGLWESNGRPETGTITVIAYHW